MLEHEIEVELQAIDVKYSDKAKAKDAMEEYLASLGYKREVRIERIIDYILSKANEEAIQPKRNLLDELHATYHSLADVKYKLAEIFASEDETFASEDEKLLELLKHTEDEKTKYLSLLNVAKMVKAIK